MYSRPGFAPSYGSYGGGMMGGMRSYGAAPPAVAQPQQQPQQADAKGKGRFVELDDADWEAQFARVGDATEAEAATAEQPQKPQEQADAAANVLDGEIPLDATESDAQLLKDLEATWAQLKGQLGSANAQDAELAQWEAQYGSQFNDLHGSPLVDTDDDDLFGTTPDIRRAPTWTRDNVDAFLSDQSAFPFSDDNAYAERPGDMYAEGLRLLAEGAPLSEAALAFEAACRQDETRAEAWKAAGETWAADEREAKGMRALEKAVACGGPAGVSAWLVRPPLSLSLSLPRALELQVLTLRPRPQSLAVAYVNEGQELRALATLEKWLSLAYPSISLPPLDASTLRSPWDASNRVVDLFLAAAQAGPQARAPGQSDELGVVDPDVQVGLGVLFYSNSEYDKAKDCFEAALSVRPNVRPSPSSSSSSPAFPSLPPHLAPPPLSRPSSLSLSLSLARPDALEQAQLTRRPSRPQDFTLWNRLGATLANSGHPETAIDAYRRALDLRPTFTRATYNLGVSCLNIGCYHEAAEHLLAALQGQMTREESARKGQTGDQDMGRAPDGSENLWHTLRRSFLCMVSLGSSFRPPAPSTTSSALARSLLHSHGPHAPGQPALTPPSTPAGAPRPRRQGHARREPRRIPRRGLRVLSCVRALSLSGRAAAAAGASEGEGLVRSSLSSPSSAFLPFLALSFLSSRSLSSLLSSLLARTSM